MASTLIGRRVSLWTKTQNRFEGTLHSLDAATQTVWLAEVVCFGTEDREAEKPQAPIDHTWPYLQFQAKAIQEVKALEEAPSPPTLDDPAVLAASSAPPGAADPADPAEDSSAGPRGDSHGNGDAVPPGFRQRKQHPSAQAATHVAAGPPGFGPAPGVGGFLDTATRSSRRRSSSDPRAPAPAAPVAVSVPKADFDFEEQNRQFEEQRLETDSAHQTPAGGAEPELSTPAAQLAASLQQLSLSESGVVRGMGDDGALDGPSGFSASAQAASSDAGGVSPAAAAATAAAAASAGNAGGFFDDFGPDTLAQRDGSTMRARDVDTFGNDASQYRSAHQRGGRGGGRGGGFRSSGGGGGRSHGGSHSHSHHSAGGGGGSGGGYGGHHHIGGGGGGRPAYRPPRGDRDRDRDAPQQPHSSADPARWSDWRSRSGGNSRGGGGAGGASGGGGGSRRGHGGDGGASSSTSAAAGPRGFTTRRTNGGGGGGARGPASSSRRRSSRRADDDGPSLLKSMIPPASQQE